MDVFRGQCKPTWLFMSGGEFMAVTIKETADFEQFWLLINPYLPKINHCALWNLIAITSLIIIYKLSVESVSDFEQLYFWHTPMAHIPKKAICIRLCNLANEISYLELFGDIGGPRQGARLVMNKSGLIFPICSCMT